MLMNLKSALKSVRTSRTMQGGAFAMLVACAVTSHAAAAPIRVLARQDQSVESSFALDFGAQGGVASASISRTDFELEIDGLDGTARFLSYDQDIDALTLPGNLSTGAIRVQIVPDSSTGSYNRTTGAFVTNELYNIEFDGDLSAYGLVSPVILPSQSVGIVDVESMTVGNVTMNWAGSNLNNPSIPLDFSYICTLFASFSVNAASFIEVEMVPLVSSMTISPELESTLMAYLNSAVAFLNADNARSASNATSSLRTFILKTQRAGATNFVNGGAQILVTTANQAISLILYPLAQPMNIPSAPSDLNMASVPSDKGNTRTPQ